MDCLIHLMALCLFEPSGVYVTGEIYEPHYRWYEGGLWCGRVGKDAHYCEGPMGELRLGVEISMTPTLMLDYGFKHQSYIMEDDNGTNMPFLSLTWRPFR